MAQKPDPGVTRYETRTGEVRRQVTYDLLPGPDGERRRTTERASGPSRRPTGRMYADVEALNQKMQSEGVWVFARGLEEPQDATVVRERNGEIVTTDGPFPEAKSISAGFWVLDVADRDAALAWAGRAMVACQGPVEVRPF